MVVAATAHIGAFARVPRVARVALVQLHRQTRISPVVLCDRQTLEARVLWAVLIALLLEAVLDSAARFTRDFRSVGGNGGRDVASLASAWSCHVAVGCAMMIYSKELGCAKFVSPRASLFTRPSALTTHGAIECYDLRILAAFTRSARFVRRRPAATLHAVVEARVFVLIPDGGRKAVRVDRAASIGVERW